MKILNVIYTTDNYFVIRASEANRDWYGLVVCSRNKPVEVKAGVAYDPAFGWDDAKQLALRECDRLEATYHSS